MGQAASHQGKGWEQFTDAVIAQINAQARPVVFLLWGNYAQRKAAFVDTDRHLVLKAPHLSPFSAHNGFFGCRSEEPPSDLQSLIRISYDVFCLQKKNTV